jgi:hypothetical protein
VAPNQFSHFEQVIWQILPSQTSGIGGNSTLLLPCTIRKKSVVPGRDRNRLSHEILGVGRENATSLVQCRQIGLLFASSVPAIRDIAHHIAARNR